MRKEHVRFVRDEIIFFDLLNAKDEVGSRQVLRNRRTGSAKLLIREDSVGSWLNNDIGQQITTSTEFGQELLHVRGAEGCPALPLIIGLADDPNGQSIIAGGSRILFGRRAKVASSAKGVLHSWNG